MPERKIYRTMAVLAVLVLLVLILVYARPFLVPLTFAALLAMLLMPMARGLQRKGLGRGLACLLATLTVVAVIGLFIFFISWQFSGFTDDAAKIEQQLTKKFQDIQAYISEKGGISPQKQDQMIKEQQKGSPGRTGKIITGLLAGAGSILASTVLVLVYIFLMLYYRDRLRRTLLRLVPYSEKHTAEDALGGIQKVTQKYLTGMAMMIVSLWVMYGIGFSVAGVKNAIFFAVLCGVLEIVPFVGNITGTLLTAGMALAQGGDSSILIGILITYALVQFIQTYILEPLVVGAEVNINPLFTIVGIVAGEQLWGIPGMILAIPLVGIFKIVCDHVEPLQPYGYLLGQDKKEDGGLKKKIKNLFKRKKQE
ncbi:AI-2E family transporter [Flaviaesturariibacter amylovorans]|uniref:AI-2E family transporter n=1 Tax=Flaviaesturariibacter amylovorans TaxID=1084520 RepID=A0ABP8HMJ9_9BACT